MEADAEDQCRDCGAVDEHELTFGTAEQQRSCERHVVRGPSDGVHQNVAPAHPTAVMKLSAPRAIAPPKATPKRRRAPEPCSVKANTSPVTITAIVMSTWATVPLRLCKIVCSGPSHGIAGPEAAAVALVTR